MTLLLGVGLFLAGLAIVHSANGSLFPFSAYSRVLSHGRWHALLNVGVGTVLLALGLALYHAAQKAQ